MEDQEDYRMTKEGLKALANLVRDTDGYGFDIETILSKDDDIEAQEERQRLIHFWNEQKWLDQFPLEQRHLCAALWIVMGGDLIYRAAEEFDISIDEVVTIMCEQEL